MLRVRQVDDQGGQPAILAFGRVNGHIFTKIPTESIFKGMGAINFKRCAFFNASSTFKPDST